MTDRCETFRDYKTTILLLSLKILNLYSIPCGLYGSPNEKNQMCELCTFSQILSHSNTYKFGTITEKNGKIVPNLLNLLLK